MEAVTPSPMSAEELLATFKNPPSATKEQRDAAAKAAAAKAHGPIAALLLHFRPALAAAGFNGIRIRGYTPGFNGGDPCRHSQRDSALLVAGRENDEDREGGTVWQIRDSHPELVALLHAVDSAPMAALLEEAHDTNWELAFRLTDDGVTVETGEYDCGY